METIPRTRILEENEEAKLRGMCGERDKEQRIAPNNHGETIVPGISCKENSAE